MTKPKKKKESKPKKTEVDAPQVAEPQEPSPLDIANAIGEVYQFISGLVVTGAVPNVETAKERLAMLEVTQQHLIKTHNLELK